MVEYDHTTHGKVTVLKNTNELADINPFRYKGYYYDTESEMHYCHNRYFVPDWGRWLNADSPAYLTNDIQSINLFAYCNNNPIKYLDYDGNIVITAAVVAGLTYLAYFLIGATVITGVAVIESETHVIENTVNEIGDAISDAIDAWKNPTINTPSITISIEDDTHPIIILPSTNPDPYARPGQKNKGES